jgi:hypothetical protein
MSTEPSSSDFPGLWAAFHRAVYQNDPGPLHDTAVELARALEAFVALRHSGKFLGSGDFLVDGDDYLAADEKARATLAKATEEGK